MSSVNVVVHVEGGAQDVRAALLELLGMNEPLVLGTMGFGSQAVPLGAVDSVAESEPEQAERGEAAKPKRTRRSKAEMEAARAAEIVVVEPTSEPIIVAEQPATPVEAAEPDELFAEYLRIAGQGIATRLAAARPIDAELLKRLRDELANGAPLMTCTDEEFARILMAANGR